MKRRIWIGLAVAVIGAGLLYLVWGGIEKNVVYFVTPSELAAKGDSAIGTPVRLGGVVAEHSIVASGFMLSFDLTDDVHTVPVVTTKTPPELFREGMGVVVEGSLGRDGRFSAERLMVKHGNEYRPPKEGEMPAEIYKALKDK